MWYIFTLLCSFIEVTLKLWLEPAYVCEEHWFTMNLEGLGVLCMSLHGSRVGFLPPHCVSRALPVTEALTQLGLLCPHSWERGAWISLWMRWIIAQLGVTSTVTFFERQKWALLVSWAILGVGLWCWSLKVFLTHLIGAEKDSGEPWMELSDKILWKMLRFVVMVEFGTSGYIYENVD